jgi:hypothetical protein
VWSLTRKSLKIPKGQSETVNRKTKGQSETVNLRTKGVIRDRKSKDERGIQIPQIEGRKGQSETINLRTKGEIRDRRSKDERLEDTKGATRDRTLMHRQ